jgi:type II secretory pathway pseudopilin PulG
MRKSPASGQAGSALIVAIVFLLLLSTLALAALRSSTTNVQIVGNMQARQEVQATAQMLIEQTVSTSEFASNPGGVATSARVEADFNGDGTTDAVAVLDGPPVCIRAKAIDLDQLDPAKETDAPCFGSASISSPVVPTGGAPAGSLCADTEWQINARGTDPRSGASVTLSQGVTVRREVVGLEAICK